MNELTNLQGYQAAAKQIDEYSKEAYAKAPRRTGNINRKSKEYRAGLNDGLMTAHCLSVWGEFPNNEHNAKRIKEVLGILNA